MIIHHKCSVEISVSFPALDRLVDFLGSSQQAEVDAITARVGPLAERLNKSSGDLLKAIKDETKT